MYRGILELKRILGKNGWSSNRTSCGLTALFLKTKISFCCFNFVNKQINTNLSIAFCINCSQYVEPKIFYKMFVVLANETPNQ